MSTLLAPYKAILPRVARVLLVAYYYPPLNSIGARRPHALATWLRRRGHEVVVLTSVQSGRDPDDAAHVVRTRDLLATRLNWRGQSLRTVSGESAADWDPHPGIWGSIFVPDVQVVSWLPFALAAARRLHGRAPFDAVVTTSPTEVVHAVGAALARRGVPWIADLRDGWRVGAPRDDWPLAVQRRFDGAFERYVMRHADAVVAVDEPVAEDLRRRHAIEVETISNGFDPEADVADAPPAGAISAGKLTLVHTGGLGLHRSIRPLLEALARLARDDESVRERVEVVLAGPRTAYERELYAEPRLAPFVRHLGFLPRRDALALQRAADALVLVVRDREATGKLYEYIAAGRPILVLGDGGAAAAIVKRTQAGTSIPADDVEAAMRALRRMLDGGLPSPPSDARDAYAYPAIAERYEQVIARVLGRR